MNLLKCKILGKRKPKEFMRCNTLEKGDNHLRCENHHYKSDHLHPRRFKTPVLMAK